MKAVEDTTLDKCQALIQYQFKDLSLLSKALTNASVAATRLDSNERMEFLGDAVLGMVVCHHLYAKYPDLLEGDMTKIKSLVVSRAVCAEVAEDMGLGDLLYLGKGMSKRSALPHSVAAAVFESIIGAIYVDGGIRSARTFIVRHIGPRMALAMEDDHQNNYKSMLQQNAQRRWSSTPEYHVLDEKGPDHSKCFEIAVVIAGKHFPSAWGISKKLAEQLAARSALVELGLLEEDTA